MREDVAISVGRIETPNHVKRFQVLLVSGAAETAGHPKPVEASKQATAQVRKMLLDAKPCGTTRLAPALRKAFAVRSKRKPGRFGYIYVLTDGKFSDRGEVLSVLREFRVRHRYRRCILMKLYGGQSAVVAKIMRLLAEETKGRCRHVDSK